MRSKRKGSISGKIQAVSPSQFPLARLPHLIKMQGSSFCPVFPSYHFFWKVSDFRQCKQKSRELGSARPAEQERSIAGMWGRNTGRGEGSSEFFAVWTLSSFKKQAERETQDGWRNWVYIEGGKQVGLNSWAQILGALRVLQSPSHLWHFHLKGSFNSLELQRVRNMFAFKCASVKCGLSGTSQLELSQSSWKFSLDSFPSLDS